MRLRIRSMKQALLVGEVQIDRAFGDAGAVARRRRAAPLRSRARRIHRARHRGWRRGAPRPWRRARPAVTPQRPPVRPAAHWRGPAASAFAGSLRHALLIRSIMTDRSVIFKMDFNAWRSRPSIGVPAWPRPSASGGWRAGALESVSGSSKVRVSITNKRRGAHMFAATALASSPDRCPLRPCLA